MVILAIFDLFTEAADDPCGDDACQNGGMCQDADTANPWCDCPYSYTGEFCESSKI